MDLVPKIERENPSTLSLSEHILPAISNWEVGKRYYIKLAAECKSVSQGSMYDPNSKSEVRADFVVSGAESLEIDGKKSVFKNGMQKKAQVQQVFSRALEKETNKVVNINIH